MTHVRGESWTIERGGPTLPLLVALFVRDTLALSVDISPDLPGLDPAVPVVVPRSVDRAEVTREWPGWWDAVLEDARAEQQEQVGDLTESNTLRHRPALRHAVTALWEDFLRMPSRSEHPVPLPIFDVMRGVESRLGREIRPFRLVVNELPVHGLVWERVAPGHVLASHDFLQDPMRTAPALRSVVDDLA